VCDDEWDDEYMQDIRSYMRIAKANGDEPTYQALREEWYRIRWTPLHDFCKTNAYYKQLRKDKKEARRRRKQQASSVSEARAKLEQLKRKS